MGVAHCAVGEMILRAAKSLLRFLPPRDLLQNVEIDETLDMPCGGGVVYLQLGCCSSTFVICVWPRNGPYYH